MKVYIQLGLVFVNLDCNQKIHEIYGNKFFIFLFDEYSFMSQLLNKLVCYSEIAVDPHCGEMSVFKIQTSSALLTEVPLGVTKTDSVFNFPSDGCAITSDYKCV